MFTLYYTVDHNGMEMEANGRFDENSNTENFFSDCSDAFSNNCHIVSTHFVINFCRILQKNSCRIF